MKKKQFMAKMAAITMAVMMGATTLPATAVNVMAHAAIATGSAYTVDAADATYYPIQSDVTSALNTVSLSTDDNDSTLESKLDAALTGKLNGSTISVGAFSWNPYTVSGTTVTMPTATATITFSNASATNKSVSVDCTLSADSLTDAEAVDAFKEYVVNYIATQPFTKGGTPSTEIGTMISNAINGFRTQTNNTVTASLTSVTPPATNPTSAGVYSIDITSNRESDQATGKVTFYSDSQVTVTKKIDGNASGISRLKDAVLSMNVNIASVTNKVGGVYQTDKIAGDINAATSSITAAGFTAQNVKVSDDNNWSFEAYDSTGTYTVTISTGAALTDTTVGQQIKDALDAYFDANSEVTTAKDKTLRNLDIAALVNKDSTIKQLLTSHAGWSINGNGDALGSDGTGTLTIGDGTNKYPYSFKVTVKTSETTEKAANKAALAKVNATAYPDYKAGSTVTNSKGVEITHNEGLLQTKILADLKDAGYNVGSYTLLPANTYEEASATSNGEYKTAINGDTVDVELTYSSDQKIADTEKVLEKFLKKGSSNGTNASVTEHKASTSAVSLDDVVTSDAAYNYGISSSLSQKIQAKSAIKATSASDAADVVKNAIDEQLSTDKVADNGVTVTVKPVNTATGSPQYTVSDGYKASTTAANGKITLLVTASVKNDFYGWSDGTNTDDVKTVTKKYLMSIDTNALKANAVKSLTLSDKTVLLSGGYYNTPNPGSESTEYTYVEITPEITPEDANSKVEYKVLDSDNSVVTTDVKVADNSLYKNGSTTAVKVPANSLGLKITKAGTYTIKATVDDAEATMTLTVKKSFDDVPATAYYNKAVAWAYQNGITAGVTENTFGSNVDVTRAQFVTWLYKYAISKDASAAIDDDDVKSVFSDVSTSAFYAKAVQWAVENGVTAGTTATTFSPDQKITRAQALTMLWRAMGSPTVGEGREYEQTLKFTDLPTNGIFRTAMVWAIHEGVTAGTTPTTCSPENICPRSQAITFIYGANTKYFS